MYPKDLVYPEGEKGVEFQLEMIRAKRPVYHQPDVLNDVCDMEMTVAYSNNITLNIPVVASLEKGKEIHVFQKTKESNGMCTYACNMSHQ